MPTAIPFDTLDYARKLETAGVPAAQAEAQAKALGEVLMKSVASPTDLVVLENNLTTKVASLESRLDAKFAALEARPDRLEARIESVRNELGAQIAKLD